MPQILFLLIAVSLLAGCASNAPKLIQMPAGEGVSVAMVQRNPANFMRLRVRWGGEIISVENRRNETWVEVLSQPLESGGRPNDYEQSYGRFLVRVGQFLDPAEYLPGQSFTATGPLVEVLQRKVGDYDYLFPVLRAESFYLWPELQQLPPVYYDRYYDPFYNHPYRHYPWWRHRHLHP